jgi:dsDNA-specific endonuclease/ATPase MutS2
MSHNIKINGTYYNSYNNAYVEVTEIRDGIVYFWDEKLEQDDGIKIKEFHQCFVLKEEKMSKFKVGDRVEVVKPLGIGYWLEEYTGKTGDVTRVYGDGDYIINIGNNNHNAHGDALKLIEKGKDMEEIKVGQVWEKIKSHSSGDDTVGKRMLITRGWDSNTGKGSDCFYYLYNGDTKTVYDDRDSIMDNFKLITNIEGEQKMEKKQTPKGKKLKVGDYIYDRDCGNTGIVTELTRDHCVYDDLADGRENFRKYEYIYLIVDKPKIKLPKEVKKK